MADQITGYDAVEGYCERLSYAAGDTVGLCVSTEAPRFDVTVSRWGGVRELVWSAANVEGALQATAPTADADGCDWDVAVAIPVDADWQSGLYLVEMTVAGGPLDRRVGYACFVVRSGTPAASSSIATTIGCSLAPVFATATWSAPTTAWSATKRSELASHSTTSTSQ